MSPLRNRLITLPIVVLGIFAWLSVSNHCALAAFENTARISMPSCHGPAPEKQEPAKHAGVECCKVLRATLLPLAKNLAACDLRTFTPHDYVVSSISAAEQSRLVLVIEWDTGPPGPDSFAESVLQRSILAHAPPLLS